MEIYSWNCQKKINCYGWCILYFTPKNKIFEPSAVPAVVIVVVLLVFISTRKFVGQTQDFRPMIFKHHIDYGSLNDHNHFETERNMEFQKISNCLKVYSVSCKKIYPVVWKAKINTEYVL